MAEEVATPPRKFAWLSRNTVLLALASLFADISTEMLYPILPVFLTQTLHASGSVVGLVDGIAQASQNIVQGFSGWLSDRQQRRKPIALAGYLLAALAKPVIGLAASWPTVLGARFFDRIGAGFRSAPRDALLASSVSEAHRGKAFGLEGFGDNLGAFVGPLLAVLLMSALAVEIRWIFYIAFVPGLLAFLMVLLVRERPATAVAAKARIDVGLKQFPKAYWAYLLATALFGIGNSSNAFLILRTQEIGASLVTTTLIYAGFNLVAALISYPAGFLSDRFGRKGVLLLSFGVFLVAYVGFALAGSIQLIALLFVFYGLYQGMFRAVGKAFASDFVPEQLRASGIGWYSATVGLLELVASIVAGLLWDHVGHAAVFLYGAVFAVVGAGALLVLVPGGIGGRGTRPPPNSPEAR
ncbi:MFS transporter [Variovorax paradoxus]|uniref:MFS transporter n=1 Tax=Variovorax paradoxus TaxID=34073 RepID=UPI00277E3722|nr:MFS transporter [Variovorax paradoxus]MDQ0586262.1 MFS family permease [Variovorax paradoxus]